MQKNQKFETTQKVILEAVIFENWLRFYFLDKEREENTNENPAIMIPKDMISKIEKENPGYGLMAKELNGFPVEFTRSRQALFNHIQLWLRKENEDLCLAEKVLNSPEFQEKLNMFQSWLQTGAQYLNFMDLQKWLELFYKWQAEQKSHG